MKKIFIFIILYMYSSALYALSSDELVSIHNSTTTQINSLASPQSGNLIYNTTDNNLYHYNGSTWVSHASKLVPYLSNEILNTPTFRTNTITLLGHNFTPTSVVTIPGFDGSINGVNIISPSKIELNITTGTINSFDIIVSNSGTLNTQWAVNGINLLNVSNSNGQSQLTAAVSCKSIIDNGFSTGDGVYWVDPNGGNTVDAFQVYCNMTQDGGGWTLVFRHDVTGGYFVNDAEADSVNVGSPGLTTQKYSILNKIDSIKSATAYEFRIYYPNENIRNHWTQTFDPRSGISPTNPVAGYTAISIDSSGSLWGGLELDSSNNTFLDGSVNHNNWWYSIGSNAAYGVGMPGPSIVVQIVEVYIR